MNENEVLANRHLSTVFKRNITQDDLNGESEKIKLFKEKEWISDEPKVLELIKGGAEQFELSTAQRILNHHGSEIFFNLCPKCRKLARTPQAKQCRHCGHDWH
ncbi:MAG TPA: hypothetical protein VD905_00460 [Flavobacteriales bacterium]|nr:hypothetical protein [Flavobacteriales bacterium]